MFVITFVNPVSKKSAFIFNETNEGRQEGLKCIVKFITDIIYKNLSDGNYKDEDEKPDEKFYDRKMKEYLGLFEDDNVEFYLMEKIKREYFGMECGTFSISLYPVHNTEKLVVNTTVKEDKQNIEPTIEG